MLKCHLIYACIISLLALPVGVVAQDSDWLVVTLYPSQGVYSAEELSKLVPVIESLWTLEDKQNRTFIRNIDSITTENTVVAQAESVQFRRLVELNDLAESGLKKIKTIADEHPLLQRRIVDDSGESLNIWVNLKYPYGKEEQRTLLTTITTALRTQYEACSVRNIGPLTGMSLQSVDLEPLANTLPLDTFKQLSKANSEYGKGALQSYSAGDILSMLNRSMNPNQAITSSEQIEQLYMIAESVRSRHLHTLASPSFKRFKLTRLVKSGAEFPHLSGFNTTKTHNWSANESNYQTLECRPEFALTQTEQY
ncbi:MAG: hypothetical protein ACJAW8_001868 [Oleispira sp.]|jgi:hypothetical protein